MGHDPADLRDALRKKLLESRDPLDAGIYYLAVECGYGAMFCYTDKPADEPNALVTAIFFARDEVSLKAAAMEVLGLDKPAAPTQ